MEIANKDVYEYILNLADDKTTINMIRANPKVFDNERVYEKVTRKRYPLLIEFRPPGLSWKEFYLRMVYTLAKLEEDYKIPYISTKGCNPEKILISATYGEVYNSALSCAAAGGNIPLIDYFLEKGSTNIDQALYSAGRYSNLNTVKYLINKGATNYELLFEAAAAGGKIDTMKFVFDTIALDINGHYIRTALSEAISHGHIDVVKFLIEKDIEILSYNIAHAEYKNQHEIAEYLKNFI